MRLRLFCVFLFLPFSAFLQGQCMTVPETLQNLVTASPLVVEGKVRSQQGVYDSDNKNIYTVNEIEIFKVFQGLIAVSTVQVVTNGGVVDNGEGADLQMDRVSNALELQIGEMGLFMLQDFPGNLTTGGNLYRPTEGVLGFIRYDLVTGTAQGVFENYTDISSELYDAVTAITNLSILNVGLWDTGDEGLYVGPSIEQSIVSQRTSGSNTAFEVHAGVGDLLTLTGTDFGTDRGSVLFPDANNGGLSYVSTLPHQIKEWTDTRILLEVPYRSGTGKIRIDKANGESLISDEDLPIGYDHINVQYTDGNGRRAYETQLTSDNGNGGYDFQFESEFAANVGASNAFISLIETWSCATGINFQIGAVTDVDEDANDGINIVRFDNGDELGGRTLAYARSRYRGCYQGETIKWFVNEIEVVVNDDYDWYYGDGLPDSSQFDFETVMLHEIGHTQQLGHVINTNEVMHYAIGPQQQKRNLSFIDTIGGEFVTDKSTEEAVCGRNVMQHFAECCEEMVVVNHPSDQTLCPDGVSAIFTYEVDFAENWLWQVKIDAVWTNLNDDSIYSGTDTSELTVLPTDDNLREFRCVVGNACNESLTSDSVRLYTRYMDISMTSVPESCDTEGQVLFERNTTEGTLNISTDNGSSFDTVWSAEASNISIPLDSGLYTVVVKDNDTGCLLNLGSIQLDAPLPLELSGEILVTGECPDQIESIRIDFNDHPDYGSVLLSIDDGESFKTTDDDSGFYIFKNLEGGSYTIRGMWADGSCSTALAPLVVEGARCSDVETEGDNTPDDPLNDDVADEGGASDETETQDQNNPEQKDTSDTAEILETEDQVELSLKLFPNPTNERIYVKSGEEEILRFWMFNSHGALVQDVDPKRYDSDTYFLDISRLQAGVYSLIIGTSKQDKVRQVVIK